MSETQTPDPDKARKTRSFGSFMLFFLILIVVLAMLAGDTIKPVNDLSQDQYLWHLYNGRVVDQQFRGTGDSSNVVEGTYTPFNPGKDGPTAKFKTQFTSLQPHEDEFRQAKAIELRTVRPSEFLALVKAGLYQPVGARSVSAVEKVQREDPAEAQRSGESATPRKTLRNQTEELSLLLVEVLASGERAWQGGSSELRSSSASTYLPKEPQHQWVRIDVGNDASLDPLFATLEGADVSAERIFLDITKDKGSKWESASTLWGSVLMFYLPWILVFFIIMFFMRQMRSQGGAGGVMSFGRSRAQLYSKENRTNVTFDDVAGAVEAKDEVKEIVEFLKNPSRFTRIGGRIPRGVLLVGPPGCGKTLLAKAIAGEAEVPFFSISGSDFVEMFVGVGASRVRDLFKQARDNSPCIIFLDEIDAVGRRRGSGMGGGHDEREQTLNAILVEMDGFSTDEGIIVVAATNRPDVLDPALLRPGRFDREVTIDLPDLEGREAILSVHLKKVKTSEEVDAHVLARSTPGYSGADLAAIVNEAAIMAVLAKRDSINMEDLEEARDKVRYGRQKKTSNIEEDDRKITAYHEAGHAIVASVLPETDPPHKVTIIPRGRALGTTMVLPEKESYHMQKRRLEAQLAMLFGGRIAEAEFCGDISAGASDDIRRATDLARAMVTELGMSQAIGPINYAERQGNDFLGTELGRGKLHSEETAREIDREVQTVLGDAYARAEEIVRENRGAIETMTNALLRYETVNGAEIKRLLEGVSLDDLRRDPDPPAAPTTPPARPDESEERRGNSMDQPGELPGNPGLSPA